MDAAPRPAPDAAARSALVLEAGDRARARRPGRGSSRRRRSRPDLMSQWKQFLDQSIEAWSQRARAGDEHRRLRADAGQVPRPVAHAATRPVKKAADQSIESALQALNMPSRTQVTSLAKQIMELEERLERLEDGIAAVAAAASTPEARPDDRPDDRGARGGRPRRAHARRRGRRRRGLRGGRGRLQPRAQRSRVRGHHDRSRSRSRPASSPPGSSPR